MIVNLVGHSASGKTTVADKLGYPILQSYTTRPPRYPGETGHEFVTPEDLFNYATMDGNRITHYEDSPVIASFTGYSYMYFATEAQLVDGVNLYVIDEKGADEVHANVKDRKVITIFLQCDEIIRYDRLVQRHSTHKDPENPDEDVIRRIEADRELRNVVKCDYVVNANRKLDVVANDIEKIIEGEMRK